MSKQNEHKENTPDRLKSIVKTSNSLYSDDSIYLIKLIKQQIKEQTNTFSLKEFDIDTKIIIDTIMYIPEFDEIVFFVITENKNSN